MRRTISIILFSVFFVTISITADIVPSVMSPLNIPTKSGYGWDQFDTDLSKMLDIGVEVVSCDVWWGLVEKKDNNFDWSYYDELFKHITNAKPSDGSDNRLKILAIMSFHQCGGNVGDDYDQPIPSWIWTKYNGTSYEGITISSNDLMYKNVNQATLKQCVALWCDDLIAQEYIDFMNAFEDHFGSMSENFYSLNVSCGPAGELRYPSYDESEGWTYPSYGYFQCYSQLAENSFRFSVLSKYGSLEGVNQAWSTQLKSESDIKPPSDQAQFMNINDSYTSTVYGRDFINWYNDDLTEHGQRMLGYAFKAFDKSLKSIPVGFKVPGIHWQMYNPTYPRGAEVCAGLIQVGSNNEYQTGANGYGYLLEKMKAAYKSKTPNVVFTCLEMNNDSGSPNYSGAKDLVQSFGIIAKSFGYDIEGENALSSGMGSYSPFWENIQSALGKDNYGYTGIDILRIIDVGVSNYSTYGAYGFYGSLIENFNK